ncbi:hypothetical protein PVAND_012526 [Polypedilum vanderplanki]|uniref:Uncharacterized protein n=1 Tax=Polypedilum vanderplanki TaxID=319348 RepID=A0A9J6CLW9_POLVA|nr:hypothetical protein PVAND_012526 [Polypedilum vanderplanki]
MSSIIFALFFITAAVNALPVVPSTNGVEDLVAAEQQVFNPIEIAVSLLRGLLAAERDQPRQLNGEGIINPYQLLSFANSFLTNLVPRNSLASNDVRDESVQDPRVLNYEQEINRRNQIGRLARVFTSFLFR